MEVSTATLPWSHAEELPWKSLSRLCHGSLYRDLAMEPCRGAVMQVLPQACQGATQRSFHGSVYRDLAVEPCRRVAMEVFIATLPGSLYRDLAMEPCRGVGMQVFTVNLPWNQGEELPWKCLPRPCRGAMQRSCHGGSSLHLVSHRRCLPTGIAVGHVSTSLGIAPWQGRDKDLHGKSR